jgi:putative membrane protein
MWTDHFWMGGMWVFPTIILIIMLFFLFNIFGRRRFPWNDDRGYQSGNDAKESALDILKKRYAKGEISKEEYDKIKADL